MQDSELDKAELINMTSEIVSAYVGNNSVDSGELPGLIQKVYVALSDAAAGSLASAAEPPKPAVAVRKSITPDYLICLEDGKRFKSLKRHLRTHYDLSPDQYREKWNLPKDYPMVAPNYSKARSQLAKKSGLGQKGRPKRRR